MARPRRALQIFSVLAVLLAWTTIAQADLIRNGDFSDFTEDGLIWSVPDYDLIGEGSYGYTPPGEPGGVPPEPIELVRFWQQRADLLENDVYDYTTGTSCVSFLQTFSVDPVQNVRLSFDVSLSYWALEKPESDWLRVILREYTIAVDGQRQFYQERELYSIATSDEDVWNQVQSDGLFCDTPEWTGSIVAGKHDLVFCLEGHGDGVFPDVSIDNVSLCPSVVPVPGAVLLGGIGLGYAGLRLRRRTGAEA